jgi:hypothetical protein
LHGVVLTDIKYKTNKYLINKYYFFEKTFEVRLPLCSKLGGDSEIQALYLTLIGLSDPRFCGDNAFSANDFSTGKPV